MKWRICDLFVDKRICRLYNHQYYSARAERILRLFGASSALDSNLNGGDGTAYVTFSPMTGPTIKFVTVEIINILAGTATAIPLTAFSLIGTGTAYLVWQLAIPADSVNYPAGSPCILRITYQPGGTGPNAVGDVDFMA